MKHTLFMLTAEQYTSLPEEDQPAWTEKPIAGGGFCYIQCFVTYTEQEYQGALNPMEDVTSAVYTGDLDTIESEIGITYTEE